MSRLATLLAAGTALAALSTMPAHAGGSHDTTPAVTATPTTQAVTPPATTTGLGSLSQTNTATGGAGGLGGTGGAGGQGGLGGSASSSAAANATGGAASARGGRASSNVTNNITTGTGGGGSGGTGNSGGGVNGVGTLTVRNVPNVGLATSTSYCGSNYGGGGAGAGWGFVFNWGKFDEDCRRQNYALILIQMGERDAALNLMAANSEVRKALEVARGNVPTAASSLASQQLTSAVETVPASRLNTAVRIPAYCEPRRGESTADRLMRTRNAC